MTAKTVTKSASDYVNPLAIDITKPDEKKKVKTKEIPETRALQVRVNLDTGHEIELNRVELMRKSIQENVAAKRKPMDGFDPVKLMLVEDMPGHKGEPTYVAFDGKHTQAAAELEKIPELDALIWKGTFAQAMAAAATLANREHDRNGAPLTFKDRINAAWKFRKALEESETPKKEWPSARDASELFGISRTYINDENIFETRKEGSKSGGVKKAEKKAKRKNGTGNGVVEAGKAHLEGGKDGQKHFEIREKDGGKPVAWYKADTPAKALEAFKEEAKTKDKKDVKLTDYITREYDPAPKPGSEKTAIAFDWNKVETDFGSVVRGFDGAADLFGFKDRAEFKNGRANLSQFIMIFGALKKEFSGKKPKQKEEPKKEEPKKDAGPPPEADKVA